MEEENFKKKEKVFLMLRKKSIVDKKIVGKIITKFEEAFFKIIDIKMFNFKKNEIYEIYDKETENLEIKDFLFEESKPSIIIEFEAFSAYLRGKKLVGHMDPKIAKLGTIRKTFGKIDPPFFSNICHFTKNKEEYLKLKKIFNRK